jgi:hypothetical protein
MKTVLFTTVISAGLLIAPALIRAGQTHQSAQAEPAGAQVTKKSPQTQAKYRSSGSGRRRARNTAIGTAGGAAAGALIGGGRGARTGAVVGGASGAMRSTRRRR